MQLTKQFVLVLKWSTTVIHINDKLHDEKRILKHWFVGNFLQPQCQHMTLDDVKQLNLKYGWSYTKDELGYFNIIKDESK